MKKGYRVFTLILWLAFVFSCGSSGGGGGSEQVSERLRVVHAAPTLGRITILQDEKKIVEGLAYGAASEYIEIDEAAKSIFSISVVPEFALPVLAVEEAVVGPYKKTLLVTESSGTPVFTFIADQTDTELPSDESRIRFINAASVASSIDIYVTSPDTSLRGRSPIVSKLAFLSSSSFIPTTPGDYRIRIAVSTGTTTTPSADDAADPADTPTTTTPTATTTPDIDFDTGDYPVDSGEEVSFYFLEDSGGGRPYRSLTLRDAGD